WRGTASRPQEVLDFREPAFAGKLAENHQVHDGSEGMLDEYFDRIAAVVQPAPFAVDERDRRRIRNDAFKTFVDLRHGQRLMAGPKRAIKLDVRGRVGESALMMHLLVATMSVAVGYS